MNKKESLPVVGSVVPISRPTVEVHIHEKVDLVGTRADIEALTKGSDDCEESSPSLAAEEAAIEAYKDKFSGELSKEEERAIRRAARESFVQAKLDKGSQADSSDTSVNPPIVNLSYGTCEHPSCERPASLKLTRDDGRDVGACTEHVQYFLEQKAEEQKSEVEELEVPEYTGWETFLDGATLRECIGCGCVVVGGPTRCVRCARDLVSDANNCRILGDLAAALESLPDETEADRAAMGSHARKLLARAVPKSVCILKKDLRELTFAEARSKSIVRQLFVILNPPACESPGDCVRAVAAALEVFTLHGIWFGGEKGGEQGL